jgi:hypothetical protein
MYEFQFRLAPTESSVMGRSGRVAPRQLIEATPEQKIADLEVQIETCAHLVSDKKLPEAHQPDFHNPEGISYIAQ